MRSSYREFFAQPRVYCVLALGAVLMAALGLRLWGIGFGLPYEYHVDEVQYVRQAATMGSQGLEPVWWNNPPFYKYVLLAEYAALLGVGRVMGWYASAADFGAQHMTNAATLYQLARATTAVFGTLTVCVIYWLGRIAYNRAVGLLSAAFLGVCFLHVRDSHFAVNDVPAAFFTAVVLLASVRVAQSGQRRWYVLAGVTLGLGFATKYSAVLAALPLLAAHLFSPGFRLAKGARALGRLSLAFASALGAAALASPYFLLTPANVLRDVRALFLQGQYGFGDWQLDAAGGFVYYAKTLSWGIGIGLLLFAGIGVLLGLLHHRPHDIILAVFVLVSYAFWGRQRMYFARFVIPLIPPLLVLAASSVERMARRLMHASGKIGAVMCVAALALIAQPLSQSLRLGYLWTQTDTRTQAQRWIEQYLPRDTHIAVDWRTHCPPLSCEDQPSVASEYDTLIVGDHGLSEHPLDWYRKRGFNYLIATSYIYRIPLADPEEDASRRDFYTSLDRELTLAQSFWPNASQTEPPFIWDEIYGPSIGLWQRERPGPVIKIYSVTP